ncbi:1,5-anhydro-D-fructose reductase isoform X1 [Eubalaena glacialis]|uniref:1,5-anhydro-D-fructose reductase isoform X1 n=1 Tax=Eubalaena glacialis TaxID=27606 RepID=UPI002A59DD94|nr:1,5-anhydro-D-fructose reductase isoform X1 [Eubalaena glacialis]
MEKIPVLGLGTWKAAPWEVTEAVKVAIDAGLYHNENVVGVGIQCKVKEGMVRRKDLFIVSKLILDVQETSVNKTNSDQNPCLRGAYILVATDRQQEKIQHIRRQIECHLYLTQKNLISFCQWRNVSMTAYRPLGGSSRGVHLMEDPVIQMISQKHKKSAAQILIRFQIQRNVIVIPKSVNPKRILENFQVFDFELSEQDMTDLLHPDRNLHLSTFPM